jgi:predicted RNase H-like HicB family nuclease
MNRFKGKISFTVEKTDTGFSCFSSKHSIYTTGNDFTELRKNALEVASFHLEDHGLLIDEDQIQLEIDLKQFFQYYRVINAKYLAGRIGMNEALLSQYVQGRKKPSSKQVSRILIGIHEIGEELRDINLFSKGQ